MQSIMPSWPLLRSDMWPSTCQTGLTFKSPYVLWSAWLKTRSLTSRHLDRRECQRLEGVCFTSGMN